MSAQSLSGNPGIWARRAMPVENNKQAARRFYEEVINGWNLDALDELLTPDGVDHTFGSQNPSRPSSSSAWSNRPSPTCTPSSST
jgi:hypothetical protein